MAIYARAMPVQAVLFDLDGTLIHSAPDIAEAANRMLDGLGLPRWSEAAVSRLIGRGAPSLVERVLDGAGAGLAPAARLAALAQFQQHYDSISGQGASLYPGVAGALEQLRAMDLRLGVVTNKYHHSAQRLLQQFGLSPLFELVVGGDTLAQRKPHPAPVRHACACLDLAPGQVLYVGDSAHDVEAANGAGVPVYCVPYGYNEGRPVDGLPATGFIDSIAELPQLLARRPLRA